MENLLIILVAVAIGTLFKRFSFFPVDTATTLNLYVIYISLPAMILLQVPRLHFDDQVLIPALVPWAIMALSALAVLLAGKILQWEREVIGSLLMVAVLGNTSFVGVPMVTAYFGEPYVPYALIYDQAATFIAVATYGTLITSIYGDGGSPQIRHILRRIATFPPFIALILAFMLNGVTYPATVTTVLEGFSATLVPLALVAVGFQLVIRLPREYVSPFVGALAIKLALAPILAWSIITLLGAEGVIAQVTIFEAGMGPMITAGAMATLAGLAPRLTSAIVGLGILFSFLTLPVIYALMS